MSNSVSTVDMLLPSVVFPYTTEKPHFKQYKLKKGVKLFHVSPDSGKDVFSAYHPMIPKRYVPPWQLDMKNRTRTLEIAQARGMKTWGGHVSYFLENRERLNATCHSKHKGLNEMRKGDPIFSPISKYNSSMLRYGRYY